MDPQKFFLAKTLQGAVDAQVIALEDLYLHIPAELLAQHIPTDVLWGIVVEGMQQSQLGFGGIDTTPPVGERFSEMPPPPTQQSPAATQSGSDFEVNEGEVDALFDQATGEEDEVISEDGEMSFDVTDGLDDEMPPIPEEGIIVEEVDWDDEK